MEALLIWLVFLSAAVVIEKSLMRALIFLSASTFVPKMLLTTASLGFASIKGTCL